MAWLSGWDNRIKLTIDHSKVDADLSHFPVTVILSSTHGDCVFDELTSDANRLKIAFTKSDGTTQLYGEIEKWDDANESAVIHVSASGWSISSSADTDFYMYYDVDHADNSTYIGDIDSTPAQSVWDADFKLVMHMADATTSSVKDSTSNNNNGTKIAANEPIEAAGKVGQGQDYDGSNDRITVPHNAVLDFTTNFTLEIIPKPDDLNQTNRYCFTKYEKYGIIFEYVDDTYELYTSGVTGDNPRTDSALVVADTNYHHLGYKYDGTTFSKFFDGTITDYTKSFELATSTNQLSIGASSSGGGVYLGILDEIRLSSSARSDAWVKATYNTLWDTLLTYGSEEVSVGNAIFFGCNF